MLSLIHCRIKAKKLELALLGYRASYMRPLFEALYYSHVEPLSFKGFMGRDSGLLCWLSLGPRPFFLSKKGPGTYCMGDSAPALQITQNLNKLNPSFRR